jgi:Ca2+-binding EF-hand superfamily protein
MSGFGSGFNQPPAPAFDADKYVTDKISRDKVLHIRETFELFLEEGKESITADSLRDVMEELNFASHAPFVLDMLESVDKDGSGAIEFNEFLAVMTSGHADESKQSDAAYDYLCKGQAGITIESFIEGARECGMTIDRNTAHECLLNCSTPQNSDYAETEFL